MTYAAVHASRLLGSLFVFTFGANLNTNREAGTQKCERFRFREVLDETAREFAASRLPGAAFLQRSRRTEPPS